MLIRSLRAAINGTIASASVVLVVIGPRWLTIREPNGGGPRLDNPNDFVRIEVELAIEHNIPIIPIPVQDVKMPPADDLPTSLASLAYRNAAKVRPNPDFQGDMIRVMKGIESVDSDIVFLQQSGKASQHVEKEPTNPETDLPPIPEGGRSEYGFYYTRVKTHQTFLSDLSPHFIGLLEARENRLSNRKGQNAHQFHLNVSILEWDAGVSLHLRL
jgi:hypothetical protein